MNPRAVVRTALVLTALAPSSAALAHDYGRDRVECSITGVREDIDTLPSPLAEPLDGVAHFVWLAETAEVVEDAFAWTVPFRFLSAPTPYALLAASTHVAELAAGAPIADFTTTSTGWTREDIVQLIDLVADSTELDVADPVEAFEVWSVSSDPSVAPTQLTGPTYDFTLTAGYTVVDRWIELHYHLPAGVKNGLSYHLRIGCGHTAWVDDEAQP
jgi:hypothetical protein